MDYKEFKEKLKEVLAERFAPVVIEENSIQKLQEQDYDALTLRKQGENIGLNMNVTAMYASYEDGMGFDDIVSRAVQMVESGFKGRLDIDFSMLNDYEQMKSLLTMQVVSKEANVDMLQKIPHQELEDLAVVYRFVLSQNETGAASVLVTNELMERYGVTHEQIHADAEQYSPESRPATLRGLYGVVNDMMGGEAIEPTEDESMYVASVVGAMSGAGVIAYPGFLEQAAEKIGGDFFVLPSSIHEVLLVKDDGHADLRMQDFLIAKKNVEAILNDKKEEQEKKNRKGAFR